MPITFHGDGTITGVAVGGLPDGVVDSDTLAANAVSTAKIADLAISTGKIANNAVTSAKSTITEGSIVQAKKTVITGPSSKVMSTGYSNVSGYEITITPTSSSNHIYLFGHINMESHQQYCSLKFSRFIGGTESTPSGFVGTSLQSNQTPGWSGNLYRAGNHDSYGNTNQPFHMVDTDHGTTSAITYKLQVMDTGGGYTVAFNRGHTDQAYNYCMRAISTIIALEVSV